MVIGHCRAGPGQSKARSSPHPSALSRLRLRPFERVSARSVTSKPPPAALGAVLTGRNGPRRARTVANRAVKALTSAARTGPKALWHRSREPAYKYSRLRPLTNTIMPGNGQSCPVGDTHTPRPERVYFLSLLK